MADSSYDEAVLYQMVKTFPDCDYWNDSCVADELEYAIARGATGATTNPIIVKNVLKKEMPLWSGKIQELSDTMTSATEEDIAWALMETIATERSKFLLPVFEKYKGRKGRLSIQVNPRYYRSSEFMLEQAVHFSQMAPNIQVKIPCSAAGVTAMEEATYRGVSINSTVCFTVSQALAVAEAVKRGLARREAEGLSTDEMSPVCTLMFGRIEDYIRQYCLDYSYMIDPTAVNWTAIAIFKKAYRLYCERKYRTRLLLSGPRHFYHWYQSVGGNYAMTINHTWQKRINESGVKLSKTIGTPVSEDVIRTLCTVPEFVKAYDENGLTPAEFEKFGVFCNTMSAFLEGYSELLDIIRAFMLPNPLNS